MTYTIASQNFIGQYRVAHVSEKTKQKIDDAMKRGKTIRINSSYNPPKSYPDAEKLCQTNNRKSGHPKHVIWAV